MSVKICTGPYMISDGNGVGMRRNWFPGVVEESFLESMKDGDIKRAPDPVTMIDGDLTWFNNSPDSVWVMVQVHRAPRVIVTTNPIEVVLHDAWSYEVGVNPQADLPIVVQDTVGGKLQVDRESVAADQLQYAKFFLEADDCQSSVTIGEVKSMQSLHFRYVCAVQTPGALTLATEFEPRYEARAYWTRLLAIATPMGTL